MPRPPTLRYPHQSCHVGLGPGHSQPCQVSSKLVKGFRLPEVLNSVFFLYLALWLIQQVRATAQRVIQKVFPLKDAESDVRPIVVTNTKTKIAEKFVCILMIFMILIQTLTSLAVFIIDLPHVVLNVIRNVRLFREYY